MSSEIILSYMCKRKRLGADTLSLLSLWMVDYCQDSSQSRIVVTYIELKSGGVCIRTYFNIQIIIKWSAKGTFAD